MLYVWYAFVVLITFTAMEAIAWALHKYLMHGLLWSLHEDHHRPHNKKMEKNDFFALVFAIPSWLFMMFGIMDGCDYKLYIGIGTTLYGICYVLVHDGLIHQRFNFLRYTENAWLIALRKGHKAHHKRREKEDGECFGMLIVPKKYIQQARFFQKHLREVKR